MSLSKEISEGDCAIRSKVVVANIDREKKSSEVIWEKDGFFGTINSDLSIHKKDFPENALVYINQAYLTVTDGELMIYCDYVILGQLIALKNPPEDLDEAIKNDKMFVPIYDNTTGQFLGAKESLGYVMVRNEPEESFLMYGYSAEHSAILFCYSKQPMPNIFRGTAFNSHKLQAYADSSTQMSDVFFYLPSITDRKESINRYKDQLSLIPVSCNIQELRKFSPEGHEFNPTHLDEFEERDVCVNARMTLYNFFKNACKVSNSNLIQNVHALIKKKNIPYSSLKWGVSMPRAKVTTANCVLVFKFI